MIDVMMPFYGEPRLLKEAVSSVVAQTDPQWRLTIVDDCYPDTSVEKWLGELAHPQIVYRRNPERLGVGGNFRRCLELASARYLTFMGCDDVLSPDYVAVVSQAVREHPRSAAVQPSVRVIDDASRISYSVTDIVKGWLAPRASAARVMAGEPLAASLLHGNWTYFPSICWRRDFVLSHSFRNDMETVLDFALLLDLVLGDEELVLLPEEVFYYRRHRHSASAQTARNAARFDEESRLFREAALRCSARGWDRAARAARWHVASRLHAAMLIPGALTRAERSSARRLAAHVLERPFLDGR